MSTARQRQEKEKLLNCAEKIKNVASHIEDFKTSHHDHEDLVRIIYQLAQSLEYISFVEGTKLVSK